MARECQRRLRSGIGRFVPSHSCHLFFFFFFEIYLWRVELGLQCPWWKTESRDLCCRFGWDLERKSFDGRRVLESCHPRMVYRTRQSFLSFLTLHSILIEHDSWCTNDRPQLQAFFLVSDDIMDASVTRRGQPCWYRNERVGLIAINDAFMLEAAIYWLLKKHFRSESYYIDIIELFHEVCSRLISPLGRAFLCCRSLWDLCMVT